MVSGSGPALGRNAAVEREEDEEREEKEEKQVGLVEMVVV